MVTYTIAQIATALGLNKQTIRRRIVAGALAADRTKGAYVVRPDAVRAWLASEGYGADTVDECMRELETVAATDPGTGTQHPAYILGRVYALLVQCGALDLERLALESGAPGRSLSQLLVKACKRPGYSEIADKLTALMSQLTAGDIAPKAWDEDWQGRWWLGYYAQQGRAGGADAAAPDGDDGTVQEDADHD